MSGWFAIKHGIRNHPIFAGRPERLGAWVAMLDEAAWSDTKQDVGGVIVDVKRGELCASQAMLEEITGLSRQKLRTFLSALESAGTISTRPATKSTKSRTIVSFCNYDKYQNAQPNSNQTATKQQPTKEQDNNIPVGGGASAPSEDASDLDPTEIIFSTGLRMLMAVGKSESQARKILGRWKAQHGPEAVVVALGRAQREGAIDPVGFIEGCFRFSKKKADMAKPATGDRRVLSNGTSQVYDPIGGWIKEFS